MEMTMSTTTKTIAESELRPLEAHELDIVSGGVGVPPQVTTAASHWKGLFQLDLQTVIWETQFRGPKHLAMPAGL
jgi:hypothetical protein